MIAKSAPQMTLDVSAVQQYFKEGYVVVEDVFSKDEVEHFRQALTCKAITKGQLERKYYEETVHLLGLTQRNPVFLELAQDERILNLIRPST